MTDDRLLANWFETQRPRLVAIALNLVGNLPDAEDVVQESWLRLQRSDTSEIVNLEAWITTVTSRISLDVLRSGPRRSEAPLPVESWRELPHAGATPEDEIVQADDVSVALLVVLESLGPAERLAFVLHDVFGLRFDEIASILGKSPPAVRKLASRARLRIREGRPGRATRADARVVDAWLAAAQDGDFAGLLELLDEGAVLRADYGAHSETVRGAQEIAARALLSARLATNATRVLVGGRPAVAAVVADRVVSVMVFSILAGRIHGLEVTADPRLIEAMPGLRESVGLGIPQSE